MISMPAAQDAGRPGLQDIRAVVQLLVAHNVCVYIYIYIHTHIHAYIHTYIHAYVRTYVRTYIHTYILVALPSDFADAV